MLLANGCAPQLEAYNSKFGAARVAQMVPHMAKVGKEVGINFSYGGDISNTLASHCLVKARHVCLATGD